jgi:hypothetical protein
MRLQQRGGRAIALCGLLLLLLSGAAAAQAIVTDPPLAISNAGDGEPFQVPVDPTHIWVAGDVFSLHNVDQYRYIVVYTRDTADGRVHGCYPVGQDPVTDRYEVSEYVHAQEVFSDTFLKEQSAKYLANIPLNEVVITDDTPVDSGKTYFGLTLGSIYGASNAPVPTSSPEPIPTAPHWPTPAPTQMTAIPTGVVSVTFTPGPTPSLPSNPQPYPIPTVTMTPVLPVTTAPTVAPGDGAQIIEPATPEPAVTSAPARTWGKRFAIWQAPSTAGRRVSVAGAASGATVGTGGTSTRTAFRAFGRSYPSWSTFGRSTT